MILDNRQSFNQNYQPKAHEDLLRSLDARSNTHIRFRVAETPIFLPEDLLNRMASIGAELIHSLLASPDYLNASARAVPEDRRVANETPHPHFLAADFGLIHDSSGKPQPMLVEMQAFPSLFAFQPILAEAYRAAHNLDSALDFYLGNHTQNSFAGIFAQTVLGSHDPENVILLEIDPFRQKTLPDFNLTAAQLGIRILDVRDLIPETRSGKPPLLCYRNGKRIIPIHRIYNRVVPEELTPDRAQILQNSYEVEWAGHPNWYYRISKFSLPYLNHPAVPPAVFLDRWLACEHRNRIPADPAQRILKPLFSFAGQGIRFAPTDDDLLAIPPAERPRYLLQQRIDFARVIHTPCGPTQPEIRILYVSPDSGTLEPVLSLVRLGRGPMMSIGHNQDQAWAGVSAAFFPRRTRSINP